MKPSVFRQVAIFAAAALSLSSVFAAPLLSNTKSFIEKNCSECHDADTKKGGLDLLDLEFSPDDKANFATWVKVHDRVKAGEMPPKKKARPEPEALDGFLKSLGSTLTTSEQAIIARDGRA